MAMQYSSWGWSCRLAMATVLALCILVVLNASASCAARLLGNRTTSVTVSMSKEHIRRYLIENGLGPTPPMG